MDKLAFQKKRYSTKKEIKDTGNINIGELWPHYKNVNTTKMFRKQIHINSPSNVRMTKFIIQKSNKFKTLSFLKI